MPSETKAIMRTAIIFLVTVISSGLCAEYTEDENVLVLTTDNFDDAISEFKHVLVEFCKLLAHYHNLNFTLVVSLCTYATVTHCKSVI